VVLDAVHMLLDLRYMSDQHSGTDAAPDNINTLLEQWSRGDAGAGEEVIARTYGELRRLARAYLRRERPGHSMQATALLHEAYIRLLRKGPGAATTREAFFRLMAAEMRRRLVDRARRRLANKRGGGMIHESLRSSAVVPVLEGADDIEAMLGRLDEALKVLNQNFPRAAQIVELRFLAGLTTDETASFLGLSSGTVKRDWTFARAWLAAAMEASSSI
jgi:RNA polymerase sigma factor (TIGR02999 family)